MGNWPWITICALGLLFSMEMVAEVRLVTGDANNNLHGSDSFLLDLSSDGKLALFSSGPPVIGSTPGITRGGLYVRNLEQNTLAFVGVPVGGENNNNPTDAVEASMSDDGRYVAWATSARSPNPRLIYWRDHQAGETRLITEGANGDSRRPILSGDGRYVAYLSIARNLPVPAASLPAQGAAAIYLYDSVTRATAVASVAHDGKGLSKGVGTGPGAYFEFDYSLDGRYVVFSTDSTNVHPSRATAANQAFFWMYRRNVHSGEVDVVSKNAGGQMPSGNFTTPVVDATGNRVAMVGSFVGLTGGPFMINGYTFAFGSDIYLKDMTSGEVWWVTKTTNGSTPDAAYGAGAIALSGDGKVVAFGSTGTKFVQENTDPAPSSDSFDIFRVDLGPNGAVTNTLITRPYHGTSNVGFFSGPLLPRDGSYVAFCSRYHASLIGQSEDSSIWIHGYAVGTIPSGAAPTPAPRLSATFNGGALTFRWPETAGFRLVSKGGLEESIWRSVSTAATLENGTNTVVENVVGAKRFYILLQQ